MLSGRITMTICLDRPVQFVLILTFSLPAGISSAIVVTCPLVERGILLEVLNLSVVTGWCDAGT
jgi:hypothetical protein